MLWTDSVFISESDLTRVDSEVISVAQSENITLDGDDGLLRAAVEEVGIELSKLMIAYGGYLNSGDLTANHYAAVMNVGIGNSVRQKASLQQVVVSSDTLNQWGWIKHWVVYWALSMFYRDAFARTDGDRYDKKLKYYTELITRKIKPNIYTMGIPIVIRPLSCPGAVFERISGSWDSSNVSLHSGTGVSNGQAYDVAISYCDMSDWTRYQSVAKPNNAESDISQIVTVMPTTGQEISINISTLNPPTGAQHPSQMLVVVVSPLTATHWNVYVGKSGGILYLQNATPIPIGITSYTLSSDPVLSGSQYYLGQYADRRLSVSPMRQRS